jgi:hypothetical protein
MLLRREHAYAMHAHAMHHDACAHRARPRPCCARPRCVCNARKKKGQTDKVFKAKSKIKQMKLSARLVLAFKSGNPTSVPISFPSFPFLWTLLTETFNAVKS